LVEKIDPPRVNAIVYTRITPSKHIVIRNYLRTRSERLGAREGERGIPEWRLFGWPGAGDKTVEWVAKDLDQSKTIWFKRTHPGAFF